MKNQKRKSRTIQFRQEPVLALFPVIGRQRRKYKTKKTITYTFVFLWFIWELETIKYKMLRAINVETSNS
jgi:hypothetical protein